MRTRVMGVVNVTADSFSDGGATSTAARAVEHGLRLAAEGCGHRRRRWRVDPARRGPRSIRPIELARVIPVVEGLAAQGITVSIDTMRAAVAAGGAGARRDDRQRCLRRACRPGDGRRRGRGRCAVGADALALGARRIRIESRPTATWSPRSAELLAAVDVAVAAGVDAREPDHRPGTGFRQDGRTQLGPAARVARVSSHRDFRCSSGHRASVSSVPCWPMRTALRGRPRTGDRHGGDLRAGRRPRGVGCPGPRRSRIGGCDQGVKAWEEPVADRIELRGPDRSRQPRRLRP